MDSQLKQRLAMSLGSICVVTLTIMYAYSPLFKPFFVLATIALICMALVEFYALAENKNYQPLVSLGLISSAFYAVNTFLSLENPQLQGFPFLLLLFALVVFFLAFFRKISHSIVNLSITAFGLIYITLPLTCILQITYFDFPTQMNDGRVWLAYVLAVTKITDVGAYIIGKTLGKNKLAPQISPKKTVEGAIGGTLISVCTSFAFYYYFFSADQTMTLWQSIGIGLLISLLAQAGDLGESVLKRDAGVKDSSHLPGFGGVLDVVDSLVFTLPFMYLLLQMHVIG